MAEIRTGTTRLAHVFYAKNVAPGQNALKLNGITSTVFACHHARLSRTATTDTSSGTGASASALAVAMVTNVRLTFSGAVKSAIAFRPPDA